MTSPDQMLDPDRLLDSSLTLYRLASRQYAELTGKGAALAPGRWNQYAEEAIYTSLDMATTVLERLAHTPKTKIPANLAMLKIKVSGRWLRADRTLTSQATSAARIVFPSLGEARKAYANPSRTLRNCFSVALPSVILPVWNVILYPERPGFWEHVSLEAVEAFSYDPRLFMEDAAFDE